MKAIQELIGYFERRGKLKPAQINKLLERGYLAFDAPAHLQGLCDQVGQTYYFRVQGQDSGNVWGTDVYTADSALASAALHAGAVKSGQAGVVKVTVVPAPKQYQGSTQNGITSHGFGAYGSAYRVEAV
jgi:hypothetical protein